MGRSVKSLKSVLSFTAQPSAERSHRRAGLPARYAAPTAAEPLPGRAATGIAADAAAAMPPTPRSDPPMLLPYTEAAGSSDDEDEGGPGLVPREGVAARKLPVAGNAASAGLPPW
jgi:hypothetical protein